jgi:hypothetical protein
MEMKMGNLTLGTESAVNTFADKLRAVWCENSGDEIGKLD